MTAFAPTDPARVHELTVENLFAVFNVRDPERRMEAIARNYTEDVKWTDPEGTFEGQEAMNAQAQKLLEGVPDFVFTAAGPVYVSRDLGLLAFHMGIPGRPPAVSGIDVALVRDGRIALLHTILTAQS
ncbi:MAG TPA: nuclear transport factor 2 family protein [Gaiellaceae bacterium]